MRNEFVEKVAMMRHAQRTYFKTRDNDWLKKSKELEKAVDIMLAAFANNQPAMI